MTTKSKPPNLLGNIPLPNLIPAERVRVATPNTLIVGIAGTGLIATHGGPIQPGDVLTLPHLMVNGKPTQTIGVAISTTKAALVGAVYGMATDNTWEERYREKALDWT